MYIVTGGAGFIGSAMIWRLNEAGIDDILVVDNLGSSGATSSTGATATISSAMSSANWWRKGAPRPTWRLSSTLGRVRPQRNGTLNS